MDLGIAGRKAIVCASSQGLGEACARALAREGVSLVINGRDLAKLNPEIARLTRCQLKAHHPPLPTGGELAQFQLRCGR